MLSVMHFSHLGVTSACVPQLPPCYRKRLDETVKTFALFPSSKQLFDCDDNCMLSVPLCTSGLHYSRCQSGGRPSHCFSMMFMFHGRTSLLLCHFVTVSCSRVCLLVLSRLHALTLRPLACLGLSPCVCARRSVSVCCPPFLCVGRCERLCHSPKACTPSTLARLLLTGSHLGRSVGEVVDKV